MEIQAFGFLVLLLINPSHGLGQCKQAALCCTGRDSSCVVQKAVANTIIEDLRDQPCYCDHACLKLNDCCPDYRQTCGVEDCQVSEWGEWSECDSTCGAGSQSRTRHVIRKAHHGGKTCPPTLQQRGCQGNSGCLDKATRASNKAALKETAMLLPVSYGASRRINDTYDIRKNLRLRNVKPTAPVSQPESHRSYCVQFEVTKVSKGCHKEKSFEQLHEGSAVCVRCEREATRNYLGNRCSGHGVVGRITRWTSLTNVNCMGKWVRRPDPDASSNDLCRCGADASFIFV